MIRTCDTQGCSTLTLGVRCLACEQTDAAVASTVRRFARGRPFVPAAAPPAEPVRDAPDRAQT